MGLRRSRQAGTESPAVRNDDGRPAATDLDHLLPRVARGDTEAFASVCDQISGAVYGLIRRIVGDQSRAEQTTAEVLVEVWRSASRFSPGEGSGLEWVMTMARRAAGKPSGAVGVAAERAAAVAAGPAPENLLTHRGLASLPGPQREALLLACSGYTWRQVADLLGVPAGTVAERLRAGLLGLGRNPEHAPGSAAPGPAGYVLPGAAGRRQDGGYSAQSGQRLTRRPGGNRLSKVTAQAAPVYAGASSLQTPATGPVTIHEEDAGMIHSYIHPGRFVSGPCDTSRKPGTGLRRWPSRAVQLCWKGIVRLPGSQPLLLWQIERSLLAEDLRLDSGFTIFTRSCRGQAMPATEQVPVWPGSLRESLRVGAIPAVGLAAATGAAVLSWLILNQRTNPDHSPQGVSR
jgi:RNA polymerase sigma-70 factor, ECF subfamily